MSPAAGCKAYPPNRPFARRAARFRVRAAHDLHKGSGHGALAALSDEPGTVVKSLMQNPETSAVLSAAQTILDFKTETARDIEGARIRSIIDPRLADHVRREALKFVDELRRAV